MIARKLLLTICVFVTGIIFSIWRRHQLYLQMLEESKFDHLIRVSGLSHVDINAIVPSKMVPPPPALVYLPTREGLTSRYRQLERMHSNARSHHRNLTVIDNHSVHYKDMGRISLCSIFVLPSSVHCSSAGVENVVNILKCTLPPVPEQLNRHEQQWLFKPSNFGLQTFDSVNKADTFSWNSTLCTLAYGFYFNISDKAHIVPIRFQEVYVSLFHAALRSLEQSFATSVGLQRAVLVVVHWRRGDQKDRCRRFEDVSVNCGTAANFIQKVRNVTAEYANTHGRHKLLVYVATNEKDASVLAQLQSVGFKLFKDTQRGARDRLPLTSLEAFLVELQLMIHADLFLGWGTTGVSQFVVRARREKAGVVGRAENFAVHEAAS